MIELKTQYPYIDGNQIQHNNLIKHYAEDENGLKYFIKQNETNTEYPEAVDVYPSKYTYTTTNINIDQSLEEKE